MMDRDDSELERALRDDLPSAHAQERVRRRLLAAGLAVGNGIAASTSAAAGGATAGGATTTGLIAKALGTSWGIKLGVAAAIAIPSVGLWVDAEPSSATVPAPRSQLAARTPEPRIESRPVRQGVSAAQVDERELAPRAPVKAPRAVELRPVEAIDPPSPVELTPPLATTAAPSRAVSTLAEETRLLDQAFAALAAGDRGRARALLDEHETQFPAGLLQKERRRARGKLAELSREP